MLSLSLNVTGTLSLDSGHAFVKMHHTPLQNKVLELLWGHLSCIGQSIQVNELPYA